MRVLVFGAGVIGRVFAARLLSAGHDVQIVARGETAQLLRSRGITLVRDGVRPETGRAETVFPVVVTSLSDAVATDVALIAIRRDQVDAALPQLADIRADVVASLINLAGGSVATGGADAAGGLSALEAAIGPARFVPAFPGVAGELGEDGVVRYLQVAQQPTTIGVSSGRAAQDASAPHARLRALLRTANLPVALAGDMNAWLQTHLIFISAFESAIAARDGDVVGLAGDRASVRDIVLAVREGFTALQQPGRRPSGAYRPGVTVTPAALRIIFLRMPAWFAARYWQRQLAGDLGRLGLAPHAMSARFTELPALQRDVRALLAPTILPRLERLFTAAGAGIR
ncbi:ketopantoate reductase family protein [Rathayibacter soli]|uniref:ketopantoate reductase family protein n=1 Tax=Rathayibacter soli TaxID=3144168 RepID=UPI0027E43D34|nr:2-dehydropantoate 2-reductase N-terminal domain-containing protein [Glaciibacter superstes]